MINDWSEIAENWEEIDDWLLARGKVCEGIKVMSTRCIG